MVSPEAPPDYTGQLPEVLDESKWMANRMTFEQMLSHSRSRASEERCRTRLDDPPEVCKTVIDRFTGGSSFVARPPQTFNSWRHRVCVENVTRTHWLENCKKEIRMKDSERSTFVCSTNADIFDPDFQHTEMKQRMAKTCHSSACVKHSKCKRFLIILVCVFFWPRSETMYSEWIPCVFSDCKDSTVMRSGCSCWTFWFFQSIKNNVLLPQRHPERMFRFVQTLRTLCVFSDRKMRRSRCIRVIMLGRSGWWLLLHVVSCEVFSINVM